MFRASRDGDKRDVVGVKNGEDKVSITSNDRRVIVSGSDISEEDEPLTVLSSTGIDCGDENDDDGFDDTLLLLLLLELLEDGDGDDGDDGDGDIDDADTNGDGVVSPEEQAEAAENDLNTLDNGEGTDGEGTNGDDGQYDDEGNEGVSASANEDGAKPRRPVPRPALGAARTSKRP